MLGIQQLKGIVCLRGGWESDVQRSIEYPHRNNPKTLVQAPEVFNQNDQIRKILCGVVSPEVCTYHEQ